VLAEGEQCDSLGQQVEKDLLGNLLKNTDPDSNANDSGEEAPQEQVYQETDFTLKKKSELALG